MYLPTDSFLCVVPPALVLLLGIATQRVVFSLLCGIVSAAFIATQGNIAETFFLVIKRLWEQSDLDALLNVESFLQSDTLLILIFLSCLGIIITLLEHSGGAAAYATAIRTRLHTQQQVENASLGLSSILFIDDYFSALTVGTIMRPLTDSFSIPRAKLAFLVDSMAAPLAILMPISSWVAVIIGQLKKIGISTSLTSSTLLIGDPFLTYLLTIPFIAYALVLVASVAYIVQRNISFGPMRTHEAIAATENNLFAGKKARKKAIPVEQTHNVTPSLWDFMIPISTFLCSVALTLLWSGEYTLFGGTNSLLEALQNTRSSLALATSSALTLFISMLFFRLRGVLQFRNMPKLMHHGVRLMAPAMLILLLSWALGTMLTHDLHTGTYLAHTLVGSVPLWLLPVMFFIAAGIVSFSMGSSWGTVAILIPIAIPMLLMLTQTVTPAVVSSVPLFFQILGAVLSGAVMGDHISPISDTTIMSATSAGAHHMDHVSTQLIYAGPIIVGTAIAFIAAGLTYSYGILISSIATLFTGMSISFLLLSMLNKTKPTRTLTPSEEARS